MGDPMTASNPNARSQSARRQRLTAAAQMAGFSTIDQLAKAILDRDLVISKWNEYGQLVQVWPREYNNAIVLR
jgi:hypothetical protein